MSIVPDKEKNNEDGGFSTTPWVTGVDSEGITSSSDNKENQQDNNVHNDIQKNELFPQDSLQSIDIFNNSNHSKEDKNYKNVNDSDVINNDIEKNIDKDNSDGKSNSNDSSKPKKFRTNWEFSLDISVSQPLKEADGGGIQNAYITYLVSTKTDHPAFKSSIVKVRRRFSDFFYLFQSLSKDFSACAIPPLPDRKPMEYITGDRFGNDFTMKRANSLDRFLKRIANHPVLRRTPVFESFLESSDWNSYMKLKPISSSNSSNGESSTVFDGLSDTLVNTFSKVSHPNKSFIEVKERATKLDEDFSQIEKLIIKIIRRDSDLQSDYSNFANQIIKLAELEPTLQSEFTLFAAAIQNVSNSLGKYVQYLDTDYVISLRDMEAYIGSLKQLLRQREQKQIDYEALQDYLHKSQTDKDSLASGANTGFIRSKVEEFRGVNHEQARRDRLRKAELKIQDLEIESENAKKISEVFDSQVLRELSDFENIKALELRSTLGKLASSNVEYYSDVVSHFEELINDLEKGSKKPHQENIAKDKSAPSLSVNS